nr:hypothetical protein [Tanacetum cinerariifolium]
MRNKGCASWDLGQMHMGRSRCSFGTVSMCVRVQERAGGRKAYLLEDKQISSVRVFDKVFSTWMAFGGNTRDLGSFGEETNEITNLHQNLEEVLLTEHGDGVVSIKRRRRDQSSDDVRDLVMVSGCR